MTTAFQRVDKLCDQWERTAGPLPPDARHLLRKLAKELVLDCAKQCDGRADGRIRGDGAGRHMVVNGEARKCADQVRHNMLCGEGESVCISCDGEGCNRCNRIGIKLDKPQSPTEYAAMVADLAENHRLCPTCQRYFVPLEGDRTLCTRCLSDFVQQQAKAADA